MKHSVYTMADFDVVLSQESPEYVLKLRDLPAEDKPREKLIKYGPDVLNAQELLAVVLTVGTKKEEVMAMTSRIMREYGERSIAHQNNVKRLMSELDIPETKACQIVACFELGRRFFSQDTGRAITIRTAKQAFSHVQDMGKLPKEHLRGLYLNSQYRLIHDEVISIGSMTANIIHPREVFRPALEYGASAVILAHNHPSGSTEASEADIVITKQLAAAGELVGIELLDHIIVAQDDFSTIPCK